MVDSYTMIIRLLCLLLFSFNGIAAQNPCFPEHPLSIAELVSIALENNPQTQLAWSHAKKMAASIGIAESNYYPHIGIDAYASHGRQFKYINGPDVNYTKAGADLTLSMMLYDFGRTQSQVELAKLALLSANWQTDWTLQKVMVKVLENAYSTIHAQETLDALEETLKDADNMLYTSKELNRSGLRAITDTYTGQATFALVKMEVIQQKALLDIQKGKLAASLGLPADTELQLAPINILGSVPKESISRLISYAKVQRADLMAQQARLAESWEKVKKAKTEYWPKVSMRGGGGADYYFNEKAGPAKYNITVNVEIPLFNGFETVYKNRYAYAEVESSEGELAQLELDIALEVLTQARSLESAQEMLVYAEENMKNSLDAYQGVMEKYRAGKEGIAEVSNALRQLATARIRYSDTQTRYLVSMANLAYATGTLTPQMENLSCD